MSDQDFYFKEQSGVEIHEYVKGCMDPVNDACHCWTCSRN
jgi:hypothetical protein